MATSDASDASVPHPVTAADAAAHPPVAKRRGSYNCGRCGLPKKGHVCSIPGPPSAAESKPRRALSFDEAAVLTVAPLAVAGPRPPGKKARAEVVDVDGPDPDEAAAHHRWVAVGPGRRVPGEVLVEVLRRLAPRGVAAAAAVSRGWRDCSRRVWRGAEEIRLRAASVTTVGALLPRCPALSSLVLRMERKHGSDSSANEIGVGLLTNPS